MESKEKRILSIIITIVIVVIVIKMISNSKQSKLTNDSKPLPNEKPVEEYVEVLDDGTKLNTSKALAKERKIDGLDIKDIQLVNRDGSTVLIANVKNDTSSRTETKIVSVKVLDKDKKEIITLKGMIVALDPGQTTQLNIGVSSDISNAYDFEIEKIK